MKINLDARAPGFEHIGDWRCGDTGAVRYAEHIGHSTWRVAIARGGALTSQYGGVEVPPAVFEWLIRPIVEASVRGVRNTMLLADGRELDLTR